MKIRCIECNSLYDDAKKTTICPHPYLMNPDDLKRKDLAIKLLGKSVQFHHQKDSYHRILSIAWNGMVMLNDMVGEFDPSLFKTKED